MLTSRAGTPARTRGPARILARTCAGAPRGSRACRVSGQREPKRGGEPDARGRRSARDPDRQPASAREMLIPARDRVLLWPAHQLVLLPGRVPGSPGPAPWLSTHSLPEREWRTSSGILQRCQRSRSATSSAPGLRAALSLGAAGRSSRTVSPPPLVSPSSAAPAVGCDQAVHDGQPEPACRQGWRTRSAGRPPAAAARSCRDRRRRRRS